MRSLIVKLGTSTVTRDGVIDEGYLAELARQIATLRAEGWQVVIVTSGSIRAGLDCIGRERAVRLPEKQAAAAIGQSLLMRAYRRTFAEHELHVAQLLLTRSDIADRQRFLNARNTVTQLFKWGVVPVVNENDTVATEEIRFGDNDTLASLTALLAEAQLVLLLSDVPGFYMPGTKVAVPRIEKITPEIEAAAGGAGTRSGTGGMRTKVEAARIATQAGIDLVIAHGREPDVVLRVARGEQLGTRFAARAALGGRKRWIAFGRHTQGALILNDCARPALVEKGSSLLPVGIVGVEGEFGAGALVALRDSAGEYGRGLTNYAAEELRQIAGLHSSEIAGVLGRADFVEAIHRDNLSLISTDHRSEA